MKSKKQSWNQRLVASVGLLSGRGANDAAAASTVAPIHAMPRFTDLAMYKSMRRYETIGGVLGLKTPFFRTIEAATGTTITIEGKSYLNFAWCDYLGLSRHPAVLAASQKAIEDFGVCVSASPMMAGQTPLHLELAHEIADFLGAEDAVLFVSGHAANISTIGAIMTPSDLIVHDEFVHNSAIMGIQQSGATAKSFRHNDLASLERILREERGKHRNAMVIVEGLYSAEGDIVDLPKVVEIKERYGAWLMVDDAHALGVLGKTGRGIAEHWGVPGNKVDIWMGTLSKTLASCGGYIAGDKALIEVLKHSAGGFIYSVGLLPAQTAAALAALRVIKSEPERVAKLQGYGQLFLKRAHELGMNTAGSTGNGMLPILPGSGIKAIRLWHRMFARGINPSLIIYPGVPMKAGRLRFFLTTSHTEVQILETLQTTFEELQKV